MTTYETVIGLETHIQLNTLSKIFCACKADSWEDAPNTNICPVCTGLPGVLPVLNERVVEKAVLLAEAMHADVQPVSHFDRKNYFYPDLPKGYQISQFDMPIALGGYLELPIPPAADPQGKGYMTRVRIHKLHIEEDAGKTKNDGSERQVDFNRCGVPLVEMVTEPDLRTADEAAQYLLRLRQLLRWIGISEADMEKGNLRCDANVSIRPVGATHLNEKTEIKNVNSIDAVREAIRKEVERQTREVEEGKTIKAWTLEWDQDAGVLRKMRSKETEADYRYFREPDLLPLHVSNEWKAAILADFPERPLERRERFMQTYKLPEYDADILTLERGLSEYFEAAAEAYGGDPKKVSNWLMNDVLRMINEDNLVPAEMRLTPQYLAELLKLVDAGTINMTTGKALLSQVQESGKAPAKLVEEQGLAQVRDDAAIRAVCEQIIANNPDEVAAYRGGKDSLMGWFVGQVMREMRGKADAKLAKEVLSELLK
ncbi:MAG: aspartyl-tRNA(Asn)/glutamyl-tRNA(Gln) amidotransferase subunit [Chloroflexota bacterium]|nr:aspartyl-tRNA(Asn)/glutamyl-tRNA(Gln) amidotransferase subunit [Chloroflexota bacterium]